MNFSYTTNPGYLDLAHDTYRAIRWHYRADNWNDYTFPASFFHDFKRYYFFPLKDSYPIFYIAILFTILRYLFEFVICKPLIKFINIDNKSDRNKFPESLWKFVVYSILWTYCAYLLIYSGRYDYFTNPTSLWDGIYIFIFIN